MLRLAPRHQLYLVLVSLFVTCLLVADIVAGKSFVLGDLSMSVGTVTFPIVFVLTDIVNEYYGRPGARFMTAVGMAMLVIAFALITGARLLPVHPTDSWVSQESFDNVFGITFRFFGASLAAYLISQIVDIQFFHALKSITESRHLWLRAIGSTAISQVVDTFVVNFGAQIGHLPASRILEITIASYFYKILVALMLTPLCYLAHGIITRRMGIEPAPIDEKAAALAPAGVE